MAETIRLATYNTELSRKGPGVLLRDIARGDDPQINAVLQIIKHANPDVLALQGFDYDLTGAALSLFAQQSGYPFSFTSQPNTGMATGLDMNGDGRLGGPRDAQGYGAFSGQGGMALLSKFPILQDQVQDLSEMLWREAPTPLLPTLNGGPFPSPQAQAVQRLSSTGHWVVPLSTPIGEFHLLMFHATPPVFDGDEDFNGKRNHDEIALWQHFLDGAVGETISSAFVIAGDANLDPHAGEGRRSAIQNLLSDTRIQDPEPRGHSANRDTDTVDWSEPAPGNMRVDYLLPSSHWRILDSGVVWPAPDDPLFEFAAKASRHHLVWLDLELMP